MSDQPSNGRDRTPLDEVFKASLHPKPIPREANRGHFALLTGKLTAQEVFAVLVAQQLNEGQRVSLNAALKRAENLGELRLREVRRLGKDREAIAHVEGCLRGFQHLRKRFR